MGVTLYSSVILLYPVNSTFMMLEWLHLSYTLLISF